MGMIRPENLQQLQMKWQEMLNSNEGGTQEDYLC